MLPSEFVQRFGRAVWFNVAIPAFDAHVIPPDDNRYLLVFWTADVNCTIHPGTSADDFFAIRTFSGANDPLFITHADHGSLVNIGWRIAPQGGFGANFVYMIGTMPLSQPTVLEFSQHADKKPKPKRGRWRG